MPSKLDENPSDILPIRDEDVRDDAANSNNNIPIVVIYQESVEDK
jgi:hypothetical protein